MIFDKIEAFVLFQGETSIQYRPIGASSARVYYNGSNLLTLTDFTGLDPEVPRGGALDIGVYSAQYPTNSISSLGINIKF